MPKRNSNFTESRATYSIKHSVNLVFGKIETVFFTFLCIVFLTTSKLNSNFSQNLSFGIISVSMPIVRLAALPFNSTINLLSNFQELVNAREENKALREEIEKFRSFYIQSLNIHNENKELRGALNFISLRTMNFKAANLIGRAHQVFGQKLFIDAGKNIGIKEGSIVTNNHGAIGRILEVFEDKSRLVLFTDATSKVPIITSKARSRGILSGNNSGLMEILYLPKNHGIEVGDWVFTSGDGDTLPPGLLVGIVKEVDGDYVAVTMAEDISAVGLVTIIDSFN
jgi:rod shape-determining protein MreC